MEYPSFCSMSRGAFFLEMGFSNSDSHCEESFGSETLASLAIAIQQKMLSRMACERASHVLAFSSGPRSLQRRVCMCPLGDS